MNKALRFLDKYVAAQMADSLVFRHVFHQTWGTERLEQLTTNGNQWNHSYPVFNSMAVYIHYRLALESNGLERVAIEWAMHFDHSMEALIRREDFDHSFEFVRVHCSLHAFFLLYRSRLTAATDHISCVEFFPARTFEVSRSTTVHLFLLAICNWCVDHSDTGQEMDYGRHGDESNQ